MAEHVPPTCVNACGPKQQAKDTIEQQNCEPTHRPLRVAVHALRHAVIVADRARVERLHRDVLEQVGAPDLHGRSKVPRSVLAATTALRPLQLLELLLDPFPNAQWSSGIRMMAADIISEIHIPQRRAATHSYRCSAFLLFDSSRNYPQSYRTWHSCSSGLPLHFCRHSSDPAQLGSARHRASCCGQFASRHVPTCAVSAAIAAGLSCPNAMPAARPAASAFDAKPPSHCCGDERRLPSAPAASPVLARATAPRCTCSLVYAGGRAAVNGRQHCCVQCVLAPLNGGRLAPCTASVGRCTAAATCRQR